MKFLFLKFQILLKNFKDLIGNVCAYCTKKMDLFIIGTLISWKNMLGHDSELPYRIEYVIRGGITYYSNIFFGFFNGKWYIDSIFNKIFQKYFIRLATQTISHFFEKGFAQWLGPEGLTHIISYHSRNLKKMHNGDLVHQSFVLFACIFLFIIVFCYSLLYFTDTPV